MRNAGFLLVALGASSLLFKSLGRQSLVMSVFGPYEQAAAIGFLAAGAVVFALSFRKKKDAPKAS